MRRFVLEQNIERFQRLIAESPRNSSSRVLIVLLVEAQRELALLKAASEGAAPWARTAQPPRFAAVADRRDLGAFQACLDGDATPALLLDPGPGLHIVDLNGPYERATMIDRDRTLGQAMFDVFPDNPGDPTADGVANLYASFHLAAETGRPHAMADQRYDIRDPAGVFVRRHWRQRNTPITDEDGRLRFLLHQIVDITNAVMTGAADGSSSTERSADP